MTETFEWGASLPYLTAFPLNTIESNDYVKTCLKDGTTFHSTDIFIATFPKTGTTMLQMACEALRGRVEMDFDEITQVQPWIELAYDMGVDLTEQQQYLPRLWKTHQLPSVLSSNNKLLSIIRDPEAAVLSMFAFLKAKQNPYCKDFDNASEWLMSRSSDINGRNFYMGNNIFGTNLWDYYYELFRIYKEPNVLVVVYESFVNDSSSSICCLCRFMGIEVTGNALRRAGEMSGKAFMSKYADRFDDSFITARQKLTGRQPPGGYEVPVPKVSMHQHPRLTDAAREELARMWTAKITEKTGIRDYQQLADLIAQHNGL